MALTPDDVGRIAQLARLELANDERAAMLTQLNGFFSIVEQMSAVECGDVEPLYTPLAALGEVRLRLREDAPGAPVDRAANQASAPRVEDGVDQGPRVIE